MKSIWAVLILLFTLPVLVIAGCAAPGGNGVLPPGTEPVPSQTVPPETIPSKTTPPQTYIPPSAPSPPFSLAISFPDGAPHLNNEAVLRCTAKSIHDLTNLKIEIKLPSALELVSGELSWLGDFGAGDELVVIQAVVRALDIGNWAVQVRYYKDASSAPDWRDALYVSIYNESAKSGKFPFWYEGKGHTAVSVSKAGDPMSQINVHTTLSGPPLLNEPAEMICTIIPYIDCADVKAEIVLPKGATLTDGSLEWQGDLTAGMPVNFLAKIVFNETGEWRIDAGMWRWFEEQYSWKLVDSMYLQIGAGSSSFSAPPPEDMSDRPPPPVTPEP